MSQKRLAEPGLGSIIVEDVRPVSASRTYHRNGREFDWVSISCFTLAWLSMGLGVIGALLMLRFVAALGMPGFGFVGAVPIALAGLPTALVFAWMGYVHHHLRLLSQQQRPG